jgi:hypothetical protein
MELKTTLRVADIACKVYISSAVDQTHFPPVTPAS